MGVLAAAVLLGLLAVLPGATPASADSSRGTFFPLPPVRILDTRTGTGAPAAAVGPGGVLSFVVTGKGGVPASDVSAVVLNVTVAAPTASSYLTVWPTGETQPTASNLNYVAGRTVPNLVKTKVGAGGSVSVFNESGSVHVLADVAGWYRAGAEHVDGARFTPLSPARILDTRLGTGAPASTIGAGASVDLQVTGQGGVPSTGVSAVTMNLTAVAPTAGSFLTAWPTGENRPNASNLNYAAGDVVPNLVIVKVGTGGRVSLFNETGQTHVLGDVVGWYSTPGGAGSVYEPLTPNRILDTRLGVGAPQARLGAGATLDIQVGGRGGVPASGVTAVALNVTAAAPTATSFLSAWPTGEGRPNASNLNYRAGQVVPNLVVVKVSAGGGVSLFNETGQTDVLADVVGWFGPAAGTVVTTTPTTAASTTSTTAASTTTTPTTTPTTTTPTTTPTTTTPTTPTTTTPTTTTPTTSSPGTVPRALTTNVGHPHVFIPTTIVAPAGATVSMTFSNPSEEGHTFTSPPIGVDRSVDPSAFITFTFTMPATETAFVCLIHQGEGMVGKLVPG